jgi:hypothetical protein
MRKDDLNRFIGRYQLPSKNIRLFTLVIFTINSISQARVEISIQKQDPNEFLDVLQSVVIFLNLEDNTFVIKGVPSVLDKWLSLPNVI